MSKALEVPHATEIHHYTCTSCHIKFPTSEDQRIHMKGEWHRYNLKRRVAQLPPISEETFKTKVDVFKEDSEEFPELQMSAKELRKKQREELLEKKRKLLELAKNRIGSNAGLVKMDDNGKLVIERSHEEEEQVRKEVEKAIEVEISEEVTQEDLIKEKFDNKIDVPNTWCIMCMPSSTIKKLKTNEEIEFDGNYQFDSIDQTIDHLFQHHNLYIPEPDFLNNKSGLIDYIYEKMSFGNVCLSCNYQGRNLEAVKHHMNSKRHIRIPFENEDEKLEFGGFYDFTSTWANSNNNEEGEWEDVSDDEIVEGENIIIQSGEEETSPDKLLATDSGLYLPNGTVVGHRSLMRYYKQNLPEPKEVSEGQGTVMAAETRRGLSNMLIDKEQTKEEKRVWRREHKTRDRNDRRAAKFVNWQEHYRDELLQ